MLATSPLPSGGGAGGGVDRRRHYFFGTMFLGAVFGRIRGRALDVAEMKRFANLAALAGYFDDLVEAAPPPAPPPAGRGDAIPQTSAKQVLHHHESSVPRLPSPRGEGPGVGPETYGRAADPSGLAIHLLQQAYTDVPAHHAEAFRENLLCVFQVETEGRQRKLPAPTEAEISRLTAEKGGCSVLLFRYLLADELSAAEHQAIFEFGHFMQLCDDIFDLWHDRQNGTATLVTVWTEQGDLGRLEACFEQQAARVGEAIRQIGISAGRRETAIQTVFFLVAVTRVCLRHYRCLQKKHGTLPLENRRQMVVDMARWKFQLQVVAELFANRSKQHCESSYRNIHTRRNRP
ncbi:MAG: hypothetical protein JNJ90_11475 [Saprospiraceae bacterium]|nr:hypothetical protein [Saprospiraceae bacterium]